MDGAGQHSSLGGERKESGGTYAEVNGACLLESLGDGSRLMPLPSRPVPAVAGSASLRPCQVGIPHRPQHDAPGKLVEGKVPDVAAGGSGIGCQLRYCFAQGGSKDQWEGGGVPKCRGRDSKSESSALVALRDPQTHCLGAHCTQDPPKGDL